MGDWSAWGKLCERLAGKWQLPLLGVSIVTLPFAVSLLRPNPARMPLNEAAQVLSSLVSGGAYDRAIDVGDLLLARADCEGVACSPVHLELARAYFHRARRDSRPTADRSRAIVYHYRRAAVPEDLLTDHDCEQMGQALEWGGQHRTALRWYEEAVRRGHDLSLELRKHIFGIRRRLGDDSPETLTQFVDAFVEDVPDDRPDLLLWAIEEKLDLLEDLGAVEDADTLLARYESRLAQGALNSRFRYLQGLVLYKRGEFDRAEVYLRSLRNQLAAGDPVDAMAGWLLGRVVLFDGGPHRPLEALSLFQNVQNSRPTAPYDVAARVGAAEALAYLERHEEAVAMYRAVMDDMASLEDNRVVDRRALQASLAVTAERERRAGRLAAARQYALLATELTDPLLIEPTVIQLQQLGRILHQLAEELAEKEEGRGVRPDLDEHSDRQSAANVFGEAADVYQRAANLDVQNERRCANSSWIAAELSAKAARNRDAIQRFQDFAAGRPQHPMVPRALLRVGQLHQAAGRINEAIAAYQETYRRFPHTLDAVRTLIPMAQCYLALGPEHLEWAEETLRVILEGSEVFTPDAPEFADALFLLGDVLERRGDYEQAISTLTEAIDRNPADPRVWRGRFLLADSYRKSALALRREAGAAAFEGEIAQIRAESLTRFQAARQLYRQIIREFEARGSSRLNRLELVYLRQAYLYEADCYFETGDFRRAQKLYEEVAGLYKDSPSMLGAYVQLINCHVFLGEHEEARAVVARAEVLMEQIGDAAFTTGVSPQSRQAWKDYFAWLQASEVF